MLLNLGSSFQLDGTAGSLTLDGGTFIQDGGLSVVTPPVQVLNGTLNATNTTMNLGPLQVGGGYPDYGIVYQSGGTILSSAIGIDRGKYLLVTNGTLYSLNGTFLINGEASFVQTGGSNYGDVHVVQGAYDLEDGLVQGINLSTYTLGRFAQNGGTVQVQNLSVGGLGTNFSPWASYNLNTGTLYCATLNLTHYGFLLQSGGTLVFSNRFDLFDPSGFGARFELDGGNALMPSLVVTNTGDYVQRALQRARCGRRHRGRRLSEGEHPDPAFSRDGQPINRASRQLSGRRGRDRGVVQLFDQLLVRAS
jgi:hypothetical protein